MQKKFNKVEYIRDVTEIFEQQLTTPDSLEVDVLSELLSSIIPTHVELGVSEHQDVDDLLSVYPYIYQLMSKAYAKMIHKVRTAVSRSAEASDARNYRDVYEQFLKVIRMQYDSLSRRITNLQEHR